MIKIPIRAAQNRQRGRMRPAGRQFDIPGLKHGGPPKTNANIFGAQKEFRCPQVENH